MGIPIRNHVLEVIKQKENYTDKELEKALTKEVEEDAYEEQIKETQEKDYEASFPNS